MEKEVDPEVIKATQSSLGKYVKRPPLSEKLLKKPPFRFLHDIVTTVLKTTGFFDGLFEENELVSENVKDRESKIQFLNKVITVLGTTTGKSISAKPSKIVAGQEPEKTNELLQCIAQALDKQLSSAEAVKKYKDGLKGKGDTKTADNDEVKTTKLKNDAKKLTSRSSEKLTSNKKDVREKSLSKPEKDKTNVSKAKQKETVQTKKDSPPKKSLTQQVKTLTKKNSVEKATKNENEPLTNRNKKNVDNDDVTSQNETSINISSDSTNEVINGKSGTAQNDPQTEKMTPKVEQDDSGKLNTSFTIAENELNSSLSSQDLMEVDNGVSQRQDIKLNDNINPIQKPIEDNSTTNDNVQNDHSLTRESKKIRSNEENSSRPQSFTRDTERTIQNDLADKTEKLPNVTRPKSVRPSSSRPGAPRLREKHDNIVTGDENLLVGKVNIIVENTPNEEDEDSSIVIVDQPNDTAGSISQNQQDLQMSSNEHGALVQQILDSQKEYSQIAGKTEIEWQFGAQKAREAVNQEIEQLRYNIQALSRVANPLGKILDHIQEDVEVMRQELQQWNQTYEEASKELAKQKTANEDSLFPLHTKLKTLDADIVEKHDKINDLKIVINKNSLRIEKLLAGGDVQ